MNRAPRGTQATGTRQTAGMTRAEQEDFDDYADGLAGIAPETAQTRRERRQAQTDRAGLVAAAVTALGEAETRLREAVTEARAVGVSWDELGELLRVSGETARRRYGSL